MNFDIESLFGIGMAKISALDECEMSWKKLRKNPTEEAFWPAAKAAYDLLIPCLEKDAVDKELIGVYTALHDFATDEKVLQKAPVLAAAAEAISGLAAYSIAETPIENARSVRAFTDNEEYIINLDKKEIVKE